MVSKVGNGDEDGSGGGVTFDGSGSVGVGFANGLKLNIGSGFSFSMCLLTRDGFRNAYYGAYSSLRACYKTLCKLQLTFYDSFMNLLSEWCG